MTAMNTEPFKTDTIKKHWREEAAESLKVAWHLYGIQMVQINDAIKNSIQLFITKLIDKGIRINAVYLFGSYAKSKEHEWSDIDVAVISPDFTDSRLEERIRLTIIANEIDSRIEPVPFRPNTFVSDDPLVWEIKTTGIPIMETN